MHSLRNSKLNFSHRLIYLYFAPSKKRISERKFWDIPVLMAQLEHDLRFKAIKSLLPQQNNLIT